MEATVYLYRSRTFSYFLRQNFSNININIKTWNFIENFEQALTKFCLGALAILHYDNLKNRMNCTRTIWRIGWIAPGWHEELDEFIPFFKTSWCKIASALRNWTNSVPQTAATIFAFSSVFILLLLGEYHVVFRQGMTIVLFLLF